MCAVFPFQFDHVSRIHIYVAQVGMSLVTDHSGKLHTKKKPTIKDVLVNQQV